MHTSQVTTCGLEILLKWKLCKHWKRHIGLKYIFVLHLAPQLPQSSWALPEVTLADKGVGRPKSLGTSLLSNLLVSYSQFSRDLTIYLSESMMKRNFLKILLGIWQYIKMKIRWEVHMDFMNSPHESIARRPISRDFHISLRSSPPGINQTNDDEDIDTTSLTFPLLFFDKRCWCTMYLKVMHLNYGWKVDATIVVLIFLCL